MVYDCQHSPEKVITIATHDTIHDTVWHTPKIVTKMVTKHDTVEKVKWCSVDYSDTYKFGSGDSTGSFVIGIRDRDCVPQYQISNFIYPVIHRTITKTVLYDTAIYKPKFHYGITFGSMANNLQKMPPFSLGMFISVKDRIIINPIMQYDFTHDQLYIGSNIGVFLK